jgi:hypothetical protein
MSHSLADLEQAELELLSSGYVYFRWASMLRNATLNLSPVDAQELVNSLQDVGLDKPSLWLNR